MTLTAPPLPVFTLPPKTKFHRGEPSASAGRGSAISGTSPSTLPPRFTPFHPEVEMQAAAALKQARFRPSRRFPGLTPIPSPKPVLATGSPGPAPVSPGPGCTAAAGHREEAPQRSSRWTATTRQPRFSGASFHGPSGGVAADPLL